MAEQRMVSVLSTPIKPRKRILFLGYDRAQTKLVDALIDSNCEVHHSADPIEAVNYDLLVCFGYRHILKKELIEAIGCPIINLHIAYLPYNRGADPNFWSFYDRTPSGVSIHLIDEGIDTGPIIYQKLVVFDKGEVTFAETYKRLIDEIEQLFIQKLDDILNDNWTAEPQRGEGSLHYVKDLPKEFSGWNSLIEDELKRLDTLLSKSNA